MCWYFRAEVWCAWRCWVWARQGWKPAALVRPVRLKKPTHQLFHPSLFSYFFLGLLDASLTCGCRLTWGAKNSTAVKLPPQKNRAEKRRVRPQHFSYAFCLPSMNRLRHGHRRVNIRKSGASGFLNCIQLLLVVTALCQRWGRLNK